MKSPQYLIGTTLLVIILLLTLPYAWKLLHILFFPKNVTIMKQLSLYQWAAAGFLGYAIARNFLKKNMSWLETFTHELTHTVVAMLFFRKVHSFHAEEETGVVSTSGTRHSLLVPMTIAPYCLPIYTYLLLALRSLMAFSGLWIYDILIGITISFHLYCFRNQTKNYQTDINQYPLFFSYLYIYTARLINLCIITVAFFPSYNVFTSTWRWLVQLYDNMSYVWSLIF